jgi:MFS family permease
MTVIDRPAPVSAMALALIPVISLLNYFDRLLLSVLAAPIKSDFHLNDSQFGFLSGPAFVLSYAVVGILFGWLGDQRSRRLIIALSLITWSVMTMLCGVSRSYEELLLARLGVGFGEAALIPASYSFLSAAIPMRKRVLIFGIYNGSSMTGILLAFVVGGPVGGALGWRAAFLLAGLPGLITASLFLATATEPSRPTAAGGATLPFSGILRALFNNRAYRWLLMGGGLSVFSSLGIIQWLPLFFLRSRGLSVTAVGLFFGPVIAGGLITGTLVGGVLGNRLTKRSSSHALLISIWGNVLIPPTYWLGLMSTYQPVALTGIFVGTTLSCVTSPAYIAAIQNTSDPRARATAMALMMLINSIIGMALLPFLVGVISDALVPTLGNRALGTALAIMISTVFLAPFAFAAARRSLDRAQS